MVARTKVADAWYCSSCMYQREEKRKQASLSGAHDARWPSLQFTTTSSSRVRAKAQEVGWNMDVPARHGSTRIQEEYRTPSGRQQALRRFAARLAPHAPRRASYSATRIGHRSLIYRPPPRYTYVPAFCIATGPCIALHLLLARRLTESRRFFLVRIGCVQLVSPSRM
jgi:hypothetical protein